MAIANGGNDMDKNEVLKILETAKDENGEVPMRLVRQAFEKLPEPCEDTISRQAAIDVVKMLMGDYELSRTVQTGLHILPSAQPEPHWIPVSERLPGDDIDCLVSIRCSAKVVVVDMATYSTDLFKVDEEDFFGNRGESGWYCFNGEYGYCKVLNVIAWMPLPEPYREERRTDERFDKQTGSY